MTVPVGAGGAVLLKDSLGYYCAFWEYSASDWRGITEFPGFKLLEESFYALNDDLCWSEVEGIDGLSGMEAVQYEYSRGVAQAVLEKL